MEQLYGKFVTIVDGLIDSFDGIVAVPGRSGFPKFVGSLVSVIVRGTLQNPELFKCLITNRYLRTKKA